MLVPLIFAAGLLAQVPPPAMPPMEPRMPQVSDGIAVTGSSTASAPAADALVTLHVSTRGNALTLTRQSLQPIIDTLVRAGADPSAISLPPYLAGSAHTNNADIVMRVHHPTAQMLEQGLLMLTTTFASMPDLLLNSAMVRLSAGDCAQLQRTAAAAAIANAKSNAAFIAKQINATLGPALEVDMGNAAAFGADGGCTSGYSIGPYGSPFDRISPSEMLTVKVYSSVRMRFAIRH